MNVLKDTASLETAVRDAVANVRITDVHTHLFPPSHDGLLLWGIDDLLTYHYLVAELFTVAPKGLTAEAFWLMPKRDQADLVWRHVFLERGGLSEAARGVITTANALGLDIAGRDLNAIRRWFEQQDAEDYLARAFKMSNVDYAVMTNNPFLAEEADCWRRDLPRAESLKTALRIDTLILDWPTAAVAMGQAATPDSAAFTAARRFLANWAARIDPLYLAASLPPEFAYPADTLAATIVRDVVLPAAKELNLPLAMMIGVRKRVNPALREGGDSVSPADMQAILHLCQENPDARFLVTALSRVDQQELCVLGRKFAHLHVFGCWWFCNNPSIIEEMTRMRLEMLGTAFTCQHSDARVLDQVIYKWAHVRKIAADVLDRTYQDQFAAGWRPTENEIRREVRAIFGGSFEKFIEN